MRAHDWFIEHRTEFAAGALDADDAATFATHLERCEECRREVARIEEELAWLPMGAAPATPRPGLQRRIIEHALGPSVPRWRNWLVPAALAASLLVAVTGWYARDRRAATLATELAARDVRVAALEDTLSVMRRATKIMQARIDVGGKEGGLVIFADARTHRWNVVVHGLPPAPPDGRYQFWFICADGMVRGAQVQVDPARPMIFTTGMPSTGGAVMGAALTLEPMHSVDGPPRGTELAHLML